MSSAGYALIGSLEETSVVYRESRTRAGARLTWSGQDPRIAATMRWIIPSPPLQYAVGREKRYLLLKKVVPAGHLESWVRKHWT